MVSLAEATDLNRFVFYLLLFVRFLQNAFMHAEATDLNRFVFYLLLFVRFLQDAFMHVLYPTASHLLVHASQLDYPTSEYLAYDYWVGLFYTVQDADNGGGLNNKKCCCVCPCSPAAIFNGHPVAHPSGGCSAEAGLE
jgi:hypothetical protein